MRRRLSPLAVLLALMLLIPSCSDRVPEGYGSLSIRVSDDTENAKMISYNPGNGNDASMTHYRVTILDSTGAEAAKSGLMSFMGGEGSFTITNMVSGSYTIKAEGFVGSEENLIATGEAPVTVRPNSTASTAIAIDTFIDEPAASVAITFELPDECVVDGKANGTLKYSVKRVDSDEPVVPEKSVTITSSIALTNGAYTATLTDSVPAGRFILLASYEDASGLVYSSADAMLIYPGLPATGTVSLDSSLAFDADFTITDKIGHSLEVTGSGEYRASDDTVVITLTKALGASENVLWYVDGKAVTPVVNGSAYTFTGLAKGDRQIIGIVWDTGTRTTIGSLVVELRVSGTISVSEKQTFVNYFDVPVVKPEESPDDGSSFWLSNDLENLVIQTLSDFVSDQKQTITEAFGNNYTDYTAKWYPNALVDNTEYYVNSIVFLSSINDIPADSNSKIYLRFNIDSDIQPAVMYLGKENNLLFLYCSKEHIVSSIGSFWTLDASLQFSVVYLFSETMGKSSEIMISEPVCVVIDDYADFWAKQGLETEEEIRAYLDSLPYESFVAPEKVSQTLTVPENIFANAGYEGSTDTDDITISGTPDNISRAFYASSTPEYSVIENGAPVYEEGTAGTIPDKIINIPPDGTYEGLGMYVAAITVNPPDLLSTGHDYYFALNIDNPYPEKGAYISCAILGSGMNVPYQLFIDGTSDLGSMIFNLNENDFPPNENMLQIGYVYLYRVLGSSLEYDENTCILNHPILVDITANQSFFNALGLTTDEEIKAYLDTIAFEDFGVATVTI